MKNKRKKISSEYNLKTINPSVAEEWHKTKNILDLDKIAPYSRKKAWWKCKKCNHEWEASIGNRTSNDTGCPKCKKETRVKKYIENKLIESALSIKNPELQKEWHNENKYKFTEVNSGSHWKVWWVCKDCTFKWKSEIRLRAAGRGCPKCSKKRGGEKTRKHRLQKSISFSKKFPNIAVEWHVKKNGNKKPDDFGFSSNKIFWWKCKNNHEWQASINNRTGKKSNCPYCSHQSSSPELRVLCELKSIFDIQHRYRVDKREIDVFIKGYNLGIEYDGWLYHQKKYKHDVEKNDYFEKRGVQIIRLRERPLSKLSNNDILISSKELFKRDINKLIDQIIKIRKIKDLKSINKYQSEKNFVNDSLFRKYLSFFPKPIPEESFLGKYPKSAKLWDYEKNFPLRPEHFSKKSEKKVWWLCKNNHSWNSSIKQRVMTSKLCTICFKESNSVKNKCSYLLEELDEMKNKKENVGKLQIGANKKVYWKCEFGHKWSTPISSRARLNAGCVKCFYQMGAVKYNKYKKAKYRLK